MRAVRRDRGEGASSYIAIVLLISMIAGAIAISGVGYAVYDYIDGAVCRVSKSADECDTVPLTGPTGPAPSGGPSGGPQTQPADYLQQQAGAGGGGSVGDRIGGPNDLPKGGDRPYEPPKGGNGPKKIRGKPGYVDKYGNEWTWDRKHKDHWDVNHPDGSHTNVFPDGRVRGTDNFPNKSKNTNQGSEGNEGNQNDYSVDPGTVRDGAIVVGGGITLGAALWWGAKLLSPACGPFVVACAVVL